MTHVVKIKFIFGAKYIFSLFERKGDNIHVRLLSPILHRPWHRKDKYFYSVFTVQL